MDAILRRSPRINPVSPGDAPQDTATQNKGDSAGTNERQAGKRKADSQEIDSETNLRPRKTPRSDLDNPPAALGVPSIVKTEFREDPPMAESNLRNATPMTGTSLGPEVDLPSGQSPIKSTEQQDSDFFVDESLFDSAVTGVESMTETLIAPGWDTGKRLRGRSTYCLKKYYGIYWLEKLKVDRSKCQERFEDKECKETENWECKGVRAVAIEYKPGLEQRRFDMHYFFDKNNWNVNKNGAPLRKWPIQVEIDWYDKVTKKAITTWEVPSTVWKLFPSREIAEDAILTTAMKRAKISSQLEKTNATQDRWKSPSPDARSGTQAGTGMETASTVFSNAAPSPVVKIGDSPSPPLRTRSKTPLEFPEEDSSQHPTSAEKQPKYDAAQSYPTPSPEPARNPRQVGTST
ncbi:hypothetical protein ACKVWC_011417 [Pyricularia oryzae]